MTSMNTLSADAAAQLIADRKPALMAAWKNAIMGLPSATGLDRPTLEDHIPRLIDEIAAYLAAEQKSSVLDQDLRTPAKHGEQRFNAGFDLLEVVAEFNILRECFQQLVETEGYALTGEVARIVHRAIDTGIGGAIEAYQAEQEALTRHRRQEHLAFIAHDLRSPLSAIITATDVLRIGGDRIDREEAYRLLRDSAYRMKGLIDGVLKEEANLAAGGVTVLRERFRLRPLVQKLLDELAGLAGEHGTRLRNEVPEGMTVDADAALLARVLQNLLSNALRFAPGGRIEVHAESDGRGGVRCAVSDDGVGIAPDRLPRIFDKGESGAPESGFGYGLAIARQYVEAHGGVLSLESAEGRGSTFSFEIPAPAR